MRVWLDVERLAAFGVSATDVQAALVRNNFLAAVGRAKGQEVQVDLLADTDLRSPRNSNASSCARTATASSASPTGPRGSSAPRKTANVRHNGKDAVYLSVWPLARRERDQRRLRARRGDREDQEGAT